MEIAGEKNLDVRVEENIRMMSSFGHYSASLKDSNVKILYEVSCEDKSVDDIILEGEYASLDELRQSGKNSEVLNCLESRLDSGGVDYEFILG